MNNRAFSSNSGLKLPAVLANSSSPSLAMRKLCHVFCLCLTSHFRKELSQAILLFCIGCRWYICTSVFVEGPFTLPETGNNLCIHWQMGRPNADYTKSRILLILKQEANPDIHDNMDEPRWQYLNKISQSQNGKYCMILIGSILSNM